MSRRVVVVGAGPPLGMSLVHAAIARGDRVIAGARRPEAVPALRDLSDEVGDRLAVVPFEAAAEDACRALAAEARARWGAVDLLADAALASPAEGRLADPDSAGSLDGTDPAAMAGLLRLHAVGPLLLARAFADALAAGVSPTFLVVSPWLGSLAGKTKGGDYADCAAAAARNMVARALMLDLAPRGIAVALANPGNYKLEREGPAFQHPVGVAAEGLLALADTATPGDAAWRDWTGAERPW